MPKMIDGEKVIKWLHETVLSELPAKTEGYDRGKEHMVQMLTSLINSGTFDPTPPVQPDIKPGDKVKHKDHKHYGIGVVVEVAKSGLRAHCHFPDYDPRRSSWEPRGYYRLDKLEVITDDPST